MSEPVSEARAHQLELKGGLRGECSLRALELNTCESTQDELWALDEREVGGGLPAPQLLYTLSQRAGRGRRGRSWLAPPGACLCVSWRLSEEGVLAERLWALSFAGGLAVAEAVRALGGACALKWPNDVLVGRRKLAGVLCEARVGALSERAGQQPPPPRVLLGIGLNLTPHPEGFEGSASLSGLIEGELPSPQALVELLSERLYDAIELLNTRGAPALMARWRAHSLPRGALLRRGELEGRLAEVTDQGALLLDTLSGSVSIEAGEVTLVGDAPTSHLRAGTPEAPHKTHNRLTPRSGDDLSD